MLLISDPTARYILLQVHCGDTADQVRQTQSPVDQRMLIRTTRTDTGVLCTDRPQLTTYAKHKNSKRVHVMLALTWIISAAISSPIALGMNYTERRAQTPTLCTFYNSDFLIYSSMGSFYIPCVVMVLLYWRIFHTIRQRTRKSVAAAAASCGPSTSSAAHAQKQRKSGKPEVPTGRMSVPRRKE